MKNNVIVTGGLGFIGKNFCRSKYDNFSIKIIFDKITYASDLEFYFLTLKPLGWKLVVGDLNDIETFEKLTGLKKCLVVNFAAESHVDHSFESAQHFMRSNALGTLSVAQFCQKNQYKLLHISTDEVYGEVTEIAADEQTLLNPTNPYSASKASADLLVQTYRKTFSLDAKIIRANNIFGHRQMSEKVIPKAIKYAYSQRKFSIHGSKLLSRHFLHTDDFSNALIAIIISWDDIETYIFNIAADESIEIRKLVKIIYQFCDADIELITIGTDRLFNDTDYKINDKVLRKLGWRPEIKFLPALKTLCLERSYIDPLF